MSVIDTPPVRTTSPMTIGHTMSAWAALRVQLDAKRAAETARVRAELDEQIVRPRTEQDAVADIRRYMQMLKVPAVVASAPWTRDVEAKLANAHAEFARLRRAGAR